MKNLVTISVYAILIAWLSLAWKSPSIKDGDGFSTKSPIDTKDSASSIVDGLYEQFDLDHLGLSRNAFELACKGYYKLLDKGRIHDGYLTICDMSQSSRQKRLYVLDMVNGTVEMNTYVAHGRNSGAEYATRFSNKPSSLQSSLGFYVTKTTYNGEHGLSLRIDGVEPGYNDKAMQRAIVVHGATYMEESWLGGGANYMGRSYGCPAVPQKQSAELINLIKNGTCLFIYHPTQKYLKSSKLLND